MITKIDYAQLTPAIYAIYVEMAENGHKGDADDGGNAMQRNIQEGYALFTGAEDLPDEFRPDYAALKESSKRLGDDDEKVLSSFNQWERIENQIAPKLFKLYYAGDYAAMVELVRETADPGPTSVHARKDWEAGKGRE